VIRVQVSAPNPVLKEAIEAVIEDADGLSLTQARPDVLVTSQPRDELLSGPPAIVLIGDGAWSSALLRLGVRAILPPDASAPEIVAAVSAAAVGLATVDPTELESLVGEPAMQPVSEPGPLTSRELEVLRMLADGAANKNIAWQLKISEHTVKFHVAQILAKLNAGTRTEAVTIGIRKGLIMV
jgi:DNA-binding NarL/FixJ family response regulator